MLVHVQRNDRPYIIQYLIYQFALNLLQSATVAPQMILFVIYAVQVRTCVLMAV